MTPLGVRSLSRPAVTAERHARVATLGRVFHQGRSSFWTLRGRLIAAEEDVTCGNVDTDTCRDSALVRKGGSER